MLYLLSVLFIYSCASILSKQGLMPGWYLILCFGVIYFAMLLPNAWAQFEVVSVLGCVAIIRKYRDELF